MVVWREGAFAGSVLRDLTAGEVEVRADDGCCCKRGTLDVRWEERNGDGRWRKRDKTYRAHNRAE